MTIEVKPLLQTAARSAFAVLVSVVGHTAIGLALGAALLVALVPELRALGRLEPMPASRVPIGALLALPAILAANWRAVLVVAAFAIAFPIAWFLAGKRNGVRKIVHRFVGAHRDVAAGLAADALLDAGARASGAAPRAEAAVRGLASRAAATMRSAPSIVRFAVRLLLGRVAELPALRATLEAARDPAADRALARERTAAALAAALDPADFAPSSRPGLLLAAAELALFTAIKVLV